MNWISLGYGLQRRPPLPLPVPEDGAAVDYAQELGDDLLDGRAAGAGVLAALYAPQQLLQLLPRDPDLHLRGCRRRALALARLLLLRAPHVVVLHPHGVRPGVMHGAGTAAATATRPLEAAVSHRSICLGWVGTETKYGSAAGGEGRVSSVSVWSGQKDWCVEERNRRSFARAAVVD